MLKKRWIVRLLALFVLAAGWLAGTQIAMAQSRDALVEKYTPLAGSEANAKTLVNGLRDGKDPKAERYDRLSHEEAIRRELKVMDATAFALARENRMPIIVFSIREPGAITAVLGGKGRATFVG